MNESKSEKTQIIIFPENTVTVIMALLKNYDLQEAQEAAIKKLTEAKESQEKLNAAEGLPSRKVADILKDIAEKNLGHGSLVSLLKNNLDLPAEKAEKFSVDLEKQILALVKKEYIENTEEEQPRIKPLVPKITKPEETTPPIKTSVLQRPTPPKETDIYRESIE